MSLKDKILSILSAVGVIAAFIFYLFWDKEHAKALLAESKTKVAKAENKAQEVAEERHEEAKKSGSVGVANNTADLLDK